MYFEIVIPILHTIILAFVFWPGLIELKKNQTKQYYSSEAKKRAYNVALRAILVPIYLYLFKISSLLEISYMDILYSSLALFVIAPAGMYYAAISIYWHYGKKEHQE